MAEVAREKNAGHTALANQSVDCVPVGERRGQRVGREHQPLLRKARGRRDATKLSRTDTTRKGRKKKGGALAPPLSSHGRPLLARTESQSLDSLGLGLRVVHAQSNDLTVLHLRERRSQLLG